MTVITMFRRLKTQKLFPFRTCLELVCSLFEVGEHKISLLRLGFCRIRCKY